MKNHAANLMVLVKLLKEFYFWLDGIFKWSNLLTKEKNIYIYKKKEKYI